LTLPQVSVVTSPIAEFTPDGLRTVDGVEHPVDTVIYGTGFRAADYLSGIEVVGRSGRLLRDDWRDGAEAYLGTLVPGYPNLFVLYGPNTNGVTSIIYILEAQAQYVGRLLDQVGRRTMQAVEVKQRVHARYNAEIQSAMAGSVWLADCNNYYRHPNGKVVTQFPYSGAVFAERLENLDIDDYDVTPRAGARIEALQ